MKRKSGIEVLATVIIALIVIGIVISFLFGAFQPGKMVYEGEVRPISEVEEIIADKLEVENPDLDLEVDIRVESEDD